MRKQSKRQTFIFLFSHLIRSVLTHWRKAEVKFVKGGERFWRIGDFSTYWVSFFKYLFLSCCWCFLSRSLMNLSIFIQLKSDHGYACCVFEMRFFEMQWGKKWPFDFSPLALWCVAENPGMKQQNTLTFLEFYVWIVSLENKWVCKFRNFVFLKLPTKLLVFILGFLSKVWLRAKII